MSAPSSAPPAWTALIALSLVACGKPFTLTSTGAGGGGAGDTLHSDEGGGGAGGSVAATGGGAGAAPACTADAECGTDTQCVKYGCVSGTCVRVPIHKGMAIASQVWGDCKITRCDDDGNLEVANDDNDVYDDANPCTEEVCQDGKLVQKPHEGDCGAPGSMCGPDGTCGQCVVSSDCPQMPFELICVKGACVPTTCKNGTLDLGETDVDCGGGYCPACGAGHTCELPSDCESKICKGPIGGKACQAPTCDDNLENGQETDVDCGGPTCPHCFASQKCVAPSDCMSGVCKQGVCQKPSCTDGVKNGDEQGVDCGPVPCNACPP